MARVQITPDDIRMDHAGAAMRYALTILSDEIARQQREAVELHGAEYRRRYEERLYNERARIAFDPGME